MIEDPKTEEFLQQLLAQIHHSFNERVKSIWLTGSQNQPKLLDQWSDIDLVIILKSQIEQCDVKVYSLCEKIGLIIGSENQEDDNSLLVRTAIQHADDFYLVDLKIGIHGNIKVSAIDHHNISILYGDSDSESVILESPQFQTSGIRMDQVDATWFKYFIVIRKIMRNDNLIGLHLLLDLLREYLVLRMIERDRKYHSNIHRFGYSEQLPSDLDFERLQYHNKNECLKYIGRLAFYYDQLLGQCKPDYRTRYLNFKMYLNRYLDKDTD